MAIDLVSKEQTVDMFGAFEADKDVNAPEDSELFKVAALAKKQVESEGTVERLQKELSDAKAELRQVALFDLPELMDELGLAEFKLSEGGTISIKESLTMSIPKKRLQECVEWLQQNNLQSLVSRDVVVPFKKGQDDAFDDCTRVLSGANIDFTSQDSINTASVKAAFNEKIRDCRDEGVDWMDQDVVPLKKFGGYLVRMSKIS